MRRRIVRRRLKQEPIGSDPETGKKISRAVEGLPVCHREPKSMLVSHSHDRGARTGYGQVTIAPDESA